MKPVIIVLIGLSGVGKSTLRDYAIRTSGLNIDKLIAVTTRTPRKGEVEGEDKYFVNHRTFKSLQDDGELCEVKEVYGNLYAFYKHNLYMSDKSAILAELHYNAYPQFKQKHTTIGIYIKPNDYNAMIQSLLQRGSTQEEYALRSSELSKDIMELNRLEENKIFDYVFINNRTVNDFDSFVRLVTQIMEDFSC